MNGAGSSAGGGQDCCVTPEACSEAVADASAASGGSVIIRSIAGREIARVAPVPPKVRELKEAICEQTGTPSGLQRLLEQGTSHVFDDDDEQLVPDASGPWEIMLVVDESPMFSWDGSGNPCGDMLVIEGGSLTCTRLQRDFVNVLTQVPVKQGIHYFRFDMQMIGDEQWCGVTWDPTIAGGEVRPWSLRDSCT